MVLVINRGPGAIVVVDGGTCRTVPPRKHLRIDASSGLLVRAPDTEEEMQVLTAWDTAMDGVMKPRAVKPGTGK